MRPSHPGLPALALLLLLACPLRAGQRGQELERVRSSLRRAEQAVAEARYGQAAELYLQVRAGAASSPNLPLARALDGLADVRRLQGRLAEAAGLYREAAGLWASLLGPRQPRLAITLHNLGAVQLARGRPELARPQLERALEIWAAAYGAGSTQAEQTRRILEKAQRRRTTD